MHPETLSETNLSLIQGMNPTTGARQAPAAPRVDETWVRYFPEHAGFTGAEAVLEHHHVDGGRWAVPIPRGAHRPPRGSGDQMHHR